MKEKWKTATQTTTSKEGLAMDRRSRPYWVLCQVHMSGICRACNRRSILSCRHPHSAHIARFYEAFPRFQWQTKHLGSK